jgi:hypothetical protein
MIEAIGPRTIWAMEPVALAQLLQRQSIEGMLPEGLKALAAFAGGAKEAKAPDPIREGATVIISVQGPLSPKGNYGGTSTEWLADRVREFGADPKIGAIVIKAGSPGGLVYGTAEAGDAIYETRAMKPIVAVASPYSSRRCIGSPASARPITPARAPMSARSASAPAMSTCRGSRTRSG